MALYREHADYGVREAAGRVAGELAARAGLQAGTARAYVYQELADWPATPTGRHPPQAGPSWPRRSEEGK